MLSAECIICSRFESCTKCIPKLDDEFSRPARLLDPDRGSRFTARLSGHLSSFAPISTQGITTSLNNEMIEYEVCVVRKSPKRSVNDDVYRLVMPSHRMEQTRELHGLQNEEGRRERARPMLKTVDLHLCRS